MPWEQINTKRYFSIHNTNRKLITLLLVSPACIILRFCGLMALLLHEQLSCCFNRVVVDSRNDWNVCVLAFFLPQYKGKWWLSKVVYYFTRFGITMCSNKTKLDSAYTCTTCRHNANVGCYAVAKVFVTVREGIHFEQADM